MEKKLKEKVDSGLAKSHAKADAEHRRLVPKEAEPRPDQTKVKADFARTHPKT